MADAGFYQEHIFTPNAKAHLSGFSVQEACPGLISQVTSFQFGQLHFLMFKTKQKTNGPPEVFQRKVGSVERKERAHLNVDT